MVCGIQFKHVVDQYNLFLGGHLGKLVNMVR